MCTFSEQSKESVNPLFPMFAPDKQPEPVNRVRTGKRKSFDQQVVSNLP